MFYFHLTCSSPLSVTLTCTLLLRLLFCQLRRSKGPRHSSYPTPAGWAEKIHSSALLTSEWALFALSCQVYFYSSIESSESLLQTCWASTRELPTWRRNWHTRSVVTVLLSCCLAKKSHCFLFSSFELVCYWVVLVPRYRLCWTVSGNKSTLSNNTASIEGGGRVVFVEAMVVADRRVVSLCLVSVKWSCVRTSFIIPHSVSIGAFVTSRLSERIVFSSRWLSV